VVALLTIHRRYGPRWLARALAEYAVVGLLATLLATPGVGVDRRQADPATPTEAGRAQAAPQAEATAGDDHPAVIRAGATVVRAVTRAASALRNAVRWLVDLWHRADQQAAAKGEAMAALPSSTPRVVLSIWRFSS
jgi:hypothetical protein